MIDERIAERRREVREQRRRARLRRTKVVVAGLLLVVALVALESSPLVGLEEVEVVGTEQLESGEVRDAADLALGTSTLRLSLDEAERRVEDELPLVRSATAQRTDPLTVRIEVTERQAALTVRGGGREVLVDRTGAVIAEGSRPGLPTVELASEPPAPGADVEGTPALANAHAAWRGLSGPLRAATVSYRARGEDELTLELEEGTRVRFGPADRLDEKVRALGAVLEDAADADVTEIDVRAPSAPVVVGPE